MAHSEKLEETALWKEVVHIKIKNDIKLILIDEERKL